MGCFALGCVMRILSIHAPYFRDLWRREHEVLAFGSGPYCDYPCDAGYVHLHELLARLPPRWTPAVIVFGDDSRPLCVLGLEDPPCPTAMLSIDAHHHAHWHGPMAGAFDVAFVAQRDYLAAF